MSNKVRPKKRIFYIQDQDLLDFRISKIHIILMGQDIPTVVCVSP
jgi:hypothetical protein